MPHRMSWFAAFGLLSDISACATHWFISHLFESLIHLSWMMELSGILLACSMPHRMALSSTCVETRMKGTSRLYSVLHSYIAS